MINELVLVVSLMTPKSENELAALCVAGDTVDKMVVLDEEKASTFKEAWDRRNLQESVKVDAPYQGNDDTHVLAANIVKNGEPGFVEGVFLTVKKYGYKIREYHVDTTLPQHLRSACY